MSTERVKYLGVTFDHNMKMAQHVREVAMKAENVVKALARIMPNVGGSKASKRKVQMLAVYSVLLYGAPIWWEAVRKKKKYTATLKRIQRRMLLRVCSAYRTTSSEALQAISGTPPIDLLMEERVKRHKAKEEAESLESINKEIIDRWQERWARHEKSAKWTKTLIPDVQKWRNRGHGEVNYYMTQILTGHGCFQAYLKRIGKVDTDVCYYCTEVDTAEHTMFYCPKWDDIRQRAEQELGARMNKHSLTEVMIDKEENWRCISNAMEDIMRRKGQDERERKTGKNETQKQSV